MTSIKARLSPPHVICHDKNDIGLRFGMGLECSCGKQSQGAGKWKEWFHGSTIATICLLNQ
jgi:hypothetical protein